MHELLLYGQVPLSRHDQVLKILAGVAAMQPRRVLERRIIYKPTREPEEPGAHLSRRGGTQNVVGAKPAKQSGARDLFYNQFVQKLSDGDFGHANGTHEPQEKALSAAVGPGEEPKWALEFQDMPDTGDRGVSIRATASTDLLSGDPHAWMIAAGPHQFVSEYYIEGHRFVHGNVVIFLYRLLHEPGVRSLETAPKVDLPAFSALQPFDPSGAYMLEAKVRVQDLNTPAVLENGVGQLKAFRQQMKGCVELELPDRLAMDTRVKYNAREAPPVRRPR
ncbi:hypothetical protein K458DRAFT_286095 [Lentithecium fluviatile CBS 122367]|uniref:Mediator of RNA polymerase II transcription subunit 18 n=1 Tax=Lentithecium fluviatile CBS 122367 TaxID=1168545 RepID=A0A6G1JP71_9PLEO|nr:hypothetical protein K458DRAFT_286095 [Lentithecium fluviatile CBS 122367]